jgi:hypothetical protein
MDQLQLIQLNDENYFSFEANQQYMSYSQYKEFLDCSARSMAKLFGGWGDKKNEAFLLGSYVHAWNEGLDALESFKKNTPELFTKKGELYAQYKFADSIIKTLESDELCMFILAGNKEVIYTAEFAGAVWKIKIDSDNDEWFSDLKVMRNLKEKYFGINWVEHFGYIGQMALYQHIKALATGQVVEPYIVAVTKEDPPDKQIIKFDSDRLKYELEKIEFEMRKIMQIKNNQIPAERCEQCAYCRETKKLDRIIHYSQI